VWKEKEDRFISWGKNISEGSKGGFSALSCKTLR
jgi:hypothetical protein